MTFLLNPFIFGASGGGGSLPEGATAHLDFENGFYYAGGSERAVGDILGGGFDAGELSASGLYIVGSNSNRPNAIGTLLSDWTTLLAAGCTVVMKLNYVNPPYGTFFLITDNTGYDNSTEYVLGQYAGGGFKTAIIEDQTSLFFGGQANALIPSGLHNVGFTLNRDIGGGSFQYAVSVDGTDAGTDTVAYAADFTVNTITIGHDGDNSLVFDSVYILSLTLYPAVDPLDLPTLTALS